MIMSDNLQIGFDPRRKPNILQRILFFMTLRQSGNSLLTNSAKGYLIAMSVVMILVSVAEGIAWGYFGTAFIPTNPKMSGIAVGTFVFLLIWFFDRMLLTSDFMEHEHKLSLNGIPETEEDKRSSKNDKYKRASFLTIRIIVALASLYIAAPYVTQLVFNVDIENKQQEKFQRAVLDVKEEYQNSQQAQLDKLMDKIEQKNNDYQQEIAGSAGSLSGFRGVGVTAKAIGQELEELKQQYQQTDVETKQRLQKIELALKSRDYTALMALDIQVNKDSPILRRNAIYDIKQQYPNEFAEVEFTVQALLMILAIILVAMKLMQFTTVKLYFSSNLQSKWNQYCLGKYDPYLPETEKRQVLLNSHEALPEEFERMMIELHHHKAKMDTENLRQVEQREQQQQAAALKTQQEQEKIELKEQHESAKLQALENSKYAYEERLAREKSETEYRERFKEIVEREIENVLIVLAEEEIRYLQTDGAEIPKLHEDEAAKIDDLHEKEKQFKTQQERIDAKNHRIIQTETDIDWIKQKIKESEHVERSHSVENLEVVYKYSQSLIRHQEILQGQQAELLGFQNNQKFYEESSQLLRSRIRDIQQQLDEIKQPLRAITKARSDVYTRKIQLLAKQGLEDAAIEKASEQEWGFLTNRIRQQIAETLPMQDIELA